MEIQTQPLLQTFYWIHDLTKETCWKPSSSNYALFDQTTNKTKLQAEITKTKLIPVIVIHNFPLKNVFEAWKIAWNQYFLDIVILPVRYRVRSTKHTEV